MGLYYLELVKAFMKFNHLSFKDYLGYIIQPMTNTIYIYFKYKRYKMYIDNLERFYRISQEGVKYNENDRYTLQER